MILKKADGRLWEIDLLRGIAVILMICFHVLYDLRHFSIINMGFFSSYMIYLAIFIASIFTVLVGISLTISYSKAQQKLSKKEIWLKFIRRGVTVFLLGMIITVLSWIYIPKQFIIFGILHCIGISIILSIPFLRNKIINLIIGFLLIITGLFLKEFNFDFNWLIPLGFTPYNFATVDYFPLLPWFGVILIGIAVGNLIYPNAKRRYHISDLSDNLITKSLCFIGRNSLIIYFLHQPIILSIIFLFSL
jgi:uncharacterized membrane protein